MSNCVKISDNISKILINDKHTPTPTPTRHPHTHTTIYTHTPTTPHTNHSNNGEIAMSQQTIVIVYCAPKYLTHISTASCNQIKDYDILDLHEQEKYCCKLCKYCEEKHLITCTYVAVTFTSNVYKLVLYFLIVMP